MKTTYQKPKKKLVPFLEYFATTALWDGPLPKYFQYTMIWSSNFQIIAFLFQSRLKFLPMYQGIARPLSVALNLTTMKEIVANGIDSTVIGPCIVFAGVYSLVFLSRFLWITRSYYLAKQISHRYQQVMTILGQIHISFTFSVINILLLSIVQDLSDNSTLKSWIIYVAIFAILLLNFSCGIFQAFFSYDPFTKFNALSCHSTQFQVITFLLKACLTLIKPLVGDPEIAYYLFTGISTILLGLRHYDLLINFPFYQYSAMRMAVMINSICLGTSCVNIIVIILKKYEIYRVDDTVFIEIIFTVITSWLWDSIFNQQVLCSLQLSDKDLTSEGKILKKLFAVTHFMANTKFVMCNNSSLGLNEIYFWSLMISVNDQLKNKSSEQGHILPENQTNSTLPVSRNQFTSDLLRTIMEKIGKSDKIKTILLSDCVGDSKYLMTSMTYLVSLSKSSCDFRTRIIVSKLKNRLEQNLSEFFEDQKKQKLDIKALVDFETVSEKFVRMIYTNTQAHLSFWKAYGKPDIQILTLSESSKLFEANHDEIHRYWTKQIEPNRLFGSALIDIYHIYLSHIRNLPVTASKLQKKIAVFSGWNHENKETMTNHSTLVLHISMSKEKTGSILYVSPHVEEVLERPAHNLIGKSINTLIPQFIRESHDEILRKHIENLKDSSNSALFGHSTDTFIIDESGHIVPCKIYLSLSPYLQNELVYIVVLKVKEIEKNEDYIIMGKDSYIEAFTENIGYHLNLSTGKRIFMPDICQNYHELKKTMTKIERYETNESDHSPRFMGHYGNVRSPISNNASIPNQFNKISLNIPLSFHRHKQSTQGERFYDTQLTTNTFCTTPMYVLKINQILRVAEKNDEKSELQSPGYKNENDLDIDQESNTSSNRVFEENLTELVQLLPTFEPLSSYRQNSSRRLIDLTHRLSSEVPHMTDTSQKNRLVNVEKSEHLTSQNVVEVKKKIRKGNGFQEQFEMDVLDKDQSVSLFTGKEYNRKVENAIHLVQKDQKLRILKTLGVAFILLSVAAVLGWQVYNNQTLGFVSGNIQVLSQTKYMLVQLIRLNRISRFVVFLDQGLLKPERYAPFTIVTSANIRGTITAPMKSLSASANTYRNNIKNALYKIDPDLQLELYRTKYTINHIDNITGLEATQEANIFDLVTKII